MPDEPLTQPPQPNTTEARTPDGTLTDQSPASTTTPASTETLAATPPATEPETLAGAKPAEGAPEAYVDFTLPEGVTLNPEALGKFTEAAKGLGLSQEGAQQLLDFHTAALAEAVKNPVDTVLTMRKEWRDSVLSDKSLAANNDLRPEVRANIGRAIDMLGPEAPAFREAMNLTGAGDHPAFVKALNFFASRLAEGKSVTGRGPAPVANPAKPNGTGAGALFPGLPTTQP